MSLIIRVSEPDQDHHIVLPLICAPVYFADLELHEAGSTLNYLVQWLKAKGIPTGPYFPAIHLLPFYAEQFNHRPGDLPVIEAVASSTLALPSHGNMDEASIQYVCDQLQSLAESLSQ